MAERPKGNLLYEILIVVLVIVLIGAIVYPANVWKHEEELQKNCRTRMEANHLIAQLYRNQFESYTLLDSMKTAVIFRTENFAVLDSMIYWDGLVSSDRLKNIISSHRFPEELRALIWDRLENKKPLAHLTYWDDLDTRLMNLLEEQLHADSVEIEKIETAVDFQTLIGEEGINIWLNDESIPRTVRSVSRTLVRRGNKLQETRYWSHFRPLAMDTLKALVRIASPEIVWTADEKDRWEVVRRNEWEQEMNQYTNAQKDSVWESLERRFWDKDKELLWKRDRHRLWKEEGEEWKDENEVIWTRVMESQWRAERRNSWRNETLASLPDSIRPAFPAMADSLWRAATDSLRREEFPEWLKNNRKKVEQTVQDLWESERRLTWEDDAREVWVKQKESHKDRLWVEIKEEIWNTEKGRFWKEEVDKLEQKNSVRRHIDRAVTWIDLVDPEELEFLVNELALPNQRGLHKEIDHLQKERSRINAKYSVLYRLGLVELFRDALIENLSVCPVAGEKYLVNVVNVEAGSFMGIECPIQDIGKISRAVRIDTASGDTTYIRLKTPFLRKILGGASISNHGNIDEDGKKSWDRRS
ncbi:MAG TPA: hypothetical protein ENN03_05630 [bacterium]|nr:hypothetical protein [bacterium]